MDIPRIYISGDSYEFTATSADYPASDSWTAKGKLVGDQGASAELTSTADGDDYDFTISAATTAGLSAGYYKLSIWVEKGSERHTIYESTVEIKPNLAAQTSALDTRSHAQKMLTLIETALANFAANPKTSVSIGATSYTITDLPTLHQMRNRYLNELDRLTAQEKINAGQKGGRKILIRLGATS